MEPIESTQPEAAPLSPTAQLLDETGMTGKINELGEESPVLEKSQPDQGAQDSPPEQPTETHETAPEVDDGTDWKKRHGDAVRWAQQMKQEKEKLQREYEQLTSERKRLEAAGLDFDEINKFIESQGGTPTRRNQMDTSAEKPPDQSNYVTKEQVNAIATRVNYDIAVRDFADTNHDFKDPDARELLDSEAWKLAKMEVGQYGQITSSVDDIVREAAKKVTAKLNKFKQLGAKSVTEKREKIKGIAIPEGQSIAKGAAEEEEEAYSPTKTFTSMMRGHRDKFKQRTTR